jgi:hypothetical protein
MNKIIPTLALSLAISTCTLAFAPKKSSSFPLTSVLFEKSPKSYGEEARAPIEEIIDLDAAMREFFSSNEQWGPAFRSIAQSSSVPAMRFIEDKVDEAFEFSSSSPWRQLEAIPQKPEDKEVLGNFLDVMQKSLLDIPTDETTEEDENDIQFLEEGRRMLVCSRFHVIQGSQQGSIESFDDLFSTCWSELMHLRQENKSDTGSLILVPGTDLSDLRRFTDMNLQRPLQWLGMDADFEVASLQRGSSAIRLIHKLGDIPTEIPTEPEE